MPGVKAATATPAAVSCGTRLGIVQGDIPGPVPLEMCLPGWQDSLDQLARPVEPEIPG